MDNYNETLAQFVKQYPNAFAPRGQACKPLKIGIHKDIAGFPKSVVRKFLHSYTIQPRYFLALQAGSPRVDLQGLPVGAVTAEDAAYAAERLALSMAGGRPAPGATQTESPAPAGRVGRSGRPILRLAL